MNFCRKCSKRIRKGEDHLCPPPANLTDDEAPGALFKRKLTNTKETEPVAKIMCGRCDERPVKISGEMCKICDLALTKPPAKPPAPKLAPRVPAPEPVPNLCHVTAPTEAKRDKCGVRYDLIPGDALKQVAKVFAVGAERYGARNWQKSRLSGENGPINHALKHINDYAAGIPDDDDPEGVNLKIHLEHAITNLLFELHYELNVDKFGEAE